MRVALIGCGAIADSFHLPALEAGSMGKTSVVLVDSDRARAETLARKYGADEIATSHRDVVGKVDAAIIASPHGTHVPIGIDLVSAGIPILVEKPLGTSVEEIEALHARASDANVPVAVNHTRRFMPAASEIGRLIRDGALGVPRRVDVAEGDRFAWPSATASMFGRRSGARGVLLDVGVHVVDLMTWWFGVNLDVDTYHDDSFGGSEAAARVGLSSGELAIAIRLSWLAKQRNSYVIEGSDAMLEWGVYDVDSLTIRSRRSGRRSVLRARGGARHFDSLASHVQKDFARAISGAGRAMVGPEDCLASMRIIDTCYRRRERFDMPWHAPVDALQHVI